LEIASYIIVKAAKDRKNVENELHNVCTILGKHCAHFVVKDRRGGRKQRMGLPNM
jgi:hypothetical protein